MPDQGPDPSSAPRLTSAEANRRKAILGQLKDALDARLIPSALVGRRTLVLRSEPSAEGRPGYGELIQPCDPQLYIFTARDTHIVTTDGEVYRFPGRPAYPTTDPASAARDWARWHERRNTATGRH
jgi:hypothetical protein